MAYEKIGREKFREKIGEKFRENIPNTFLYGLGKIPESSKIPRKFRQITLTIFKQQPRRRRPRLEGPRGGPKTRVTIRNLKT